MGVACCAEAEMNQPSAIPEQLKDLPSVNWEGISDVYARFEASLPFNRILVSQMIEKIEEAEKEAGGNGFVTLQTLRKVLPTPAWAQLNDPSSTLSQVLLSEYFKDSAKGTGPDQIDAEILNLFALLHCAGKPIDKTNVLYGILQEGGFEKHEEISAADKDLIPAFNKLCSLVTVDIFALGIATGNAAQIYDEGECKKLMNKDNIYVIREEMWLEEIYGALSRLRNDAWVENVSKKANWIFHPSELRKKIFETAQVTARH